jgi:hypothetical protein
MGLYWDDDFHRAALSRPALPLLSRSLAELLVFIEDDEVAPLPRPGIPF